jgi:chaperonin GroEL
VSKALESPLRQIVENAGVEGSIVVGKMLEKSGNFSFDAQKEEYVNMVQAGIVDRTMWFGWHFRMLLGGRLFL